MEKKTTKDYLLELQNLSDKHTSLKKEVEYLILEGEKIEDKLKDVERIFSISESINLIIKEMEDLELEYENKLKEYKNNK